MDESGLPPDESRKNVSDQPLDQAFFRDTELGQTLYAYLLCEDLDCAEAQQAVQQQGSKAVLPLVQVLQHGMPAETLRHLTGNGTALIRTRAIHALGLLGDRRALAYLTQALEDSDPLVRARSVEALSKLGEPSVSSSMVPLLCDPDALVRETAAVALGKLKSREAVVALRKALKTERTPHVRKAMEAAVQAIE